MQAQNKKIVKNFFATASIVLAILIGVNGTRDVLSGKPTLDVMPWMITQAIELINRTQKSIEESDRIKKDRIAQNPDD